MVSQFVIVGSTGLIHQVFCAAASRSLGSCGGLWILSMAPSLYCTGKRGTVVSDSVLYWVPRLCPNLQT